MEPSKQYERVLAEDIMAGDHVAWPSRTATFHRVTDRRRTETMAILSFADHPTVRAKRTARWWREVRPPAPWYVSSAHLG